MFGCGNCGKPSVSGWRIPVVTPHKRTAIGMTLANALASLNRQRKMGAGETEIVSISGPIRHGTVPGPQAIRQFKGGVAVGPTGPLLQADCDRAATWNSAVRASGGEMPKRRHASRPKGRSLTTGHPEPGSMGDSLAFKRNPRKRRISTGSRNYHYRLFVLIVVACLAR